jgi:hypothetical protein
LVSKDPHGFLVGDANERAIRAFSLALAAPYLATDEIVKVRNIINVADNGHQIRGGTGVGVLPHSRDRHEDSSGISVEVLTR